MTAQTLISRPIIVVPDLGRKEAASDESDFGPGEFLRHLLALGSIFVAGYLWLLIGA